MTESLLDEERLISLVLRRDEDACRTLYRKHADVVFLTALKMVGGDDQKAEDIAQEAWRRAIGRLADFSRRSRFRTWVVGIAIRCAMEMRREGEREASPDANPRGCSDPNHEVKVDLQTALEELPQGFRTVLMLHDVEGYTHEQIGKLMGTKAGTSKSQLSRARARVRQRLGLDYR